MVVVQQRRAATRLLCYCQDRGILTPQWPPCACDLQSTVIACVSVFFCVRHSTRTQFFARMSDHGPPNPQFFSTSITKIDGRCSSSSDWRCTTARQAMCALVQDTSARSLFGHMYRRSETSGLCKAADVQRSGPGPGRRTHEAVQHQTQFLDHVLSMGITITRRPSTISPSTSSSCSGRASLVSSVKTRHISWSLRVGIGGVCVQKVAGASPDRWDHGATMGQRGPPGRGDNVFVHTPITRPAA